MSRLPPGERRRGQVARERVERMRRRAAEGAGGMPLPGQPGRDGDSPAGKIHLGVSSVSHLLSAERSQRPLRMDQLRRPSSLPIGPFVPLPPGTARTAARRVAVGAAASLAVVAVPSVASAAPPTGPFISEIHYDNAGTDS